MSESTQKTLAWPSLAMAAGTVVLAGAVALPPIARLVQASPLPPFGPAQALMVDAIERTALGAGIVLMGLVAASALAGWQRRWLQVGVFLSGAILMSPITAVFILAAPGTRQLTDTAPNTVSTPGTGIELTVDDPSYRPFWGDGARNGCSDCVLALSAEGVGRLEVLLLPTLGQEATPWARHAAQLFDTEVTLSETTFLDRPALHGAELADGYHRRAWFVHGGAMGHVVFVAVGEDDLAEEHIEALLRGLAFHDDLDPGWRPRPIEPEAGPGWRVDGDTLVSASPSITWEAAPGGEISRGAMLERQSSTAPLSWHGPLRTVQVDLHPHPTHVPARTDEPAGSLRWQDQDLAFVRTASHDRWWGAAAPLQDDAWLSAWVDLSVHDDPQAAVEAALARLSPAPPEPGLWEAATLPRIDAWGSLHRDLWLGRTVPAMVRLPPGAWRALAPEDTSPGDTFDELLHVDDDRALRSLRVFHDRGEHDPQTAHRTAARRLVTGRDESLDGPSTQWTGTGEDPWLWRLDTLVLPDGTLLHALAEGASSGAADIEACLAAVEVLPALPPTSLAITTTLDDPVLVGADDPSADAIVHLHTGLVLPRPGNDMRAIVADGSGLALWSGWTDDGAESLWVAAYTGRDGTPTPRAWTDWLVTRDVATDLRPALGPTVDQPQAQPVPDTRYRHYRSRNQHVHAWTFVRDGLGVVLYALDDDDRRDGWVDDVTFLDTDALVTLLRAMEPAEVSRARDTAVVPEDAPDAGTPAPPTDDVPALPDPTPDDTGD